MNSDEKPTALAELEIQCLRLMDKFWQGAGIGSERWFHHI